MSPFIKCPCGEKYQTDEKHLGYSIKCHKCNRVIAISDAKANSYNSGARPNSTYSNNKTIFEDVSVEPKTPFFKNIVIPIAGVLALLIGIILTISSLREQKNTQSANSNLTQSSTSTTPLLSLSNVGNTDISINTLKTSNTSNKSIEIARANSLVQAANNQPVNTTEAQNNNSLEAQNNNSFQQSPSPISTPEIVRYATGKNLITPQNTGGRGTLLISNGTSSDAIAKLVDVETNKTIRLTYIQANSDLTVKNIRVGNYVLKFSLGNGYIPDSGKFQYSQSYSRFDEVLNFEEHREGDRLVWANFSVTLNKVLYGNAKTSSIDESDFEDK